MTTDPNATDAYAPYPVQHPDPAYSHITEPEYYFSVLVITPDPRGRGVCDQIKECADMMWHEYGHAVHLLGVAPPDSIPAWSGIRSYAPPSPTPTRLFDFSAVTRPSTN